MHQGLAKLLKNVLDGPGGRLANCSQAAVVMSWACFILVFWGSRAQALDLGNTGLFDRSRLHVEAQNELELAQERVEKARGEADQARRQLDDFIVRHFEEHHRRKELAWPSDAQPQPLPQAEPTRPDPELERVRLQIQQWTAQRNELLERYTSEHPDVVDLDDRISELSVKLKAIESPAAENSHSSNNLDPRTEAGNQQWAERLEAEKTWQQEATQQYEPLFERWQAAQRELRLALEAAKSAAERFSAIQAAEPVVPSSLKTAKTQGEPPLVQQPDPPISAIQKSGSQLGSQPVTLVALVLALAIATWTAVNLARSSADPLFANADEVATSLALPVVGIFPSAESLGVGQPASKPLIVGILFLAKVLLAFLVFGLVAYLVQTADFF